MCTQRFIVHVDMDAFFASVEERDKPGLRGKPVVIGADPKGGRGRGVVSTCNYQARKCGIHSAMPISRAFQLCPRAVYLPPDMEKYNTESESIYTIFYDFTPCVEPVGIDEAFLDITASAHLFGSPQNACRAIKEKIHCLTGLTASVGLAPTKMAAKIASDMCKPDGSLEVTQDNLLTFLWALPIEKIWGLGKKSTHILNGLGVRTIGELAKKDVSFLEGVFGVQGVYFHDLAWGRDDRQVEPGGEAQSISNEITFETDTHDSALVKGALLDLSESVSRRLRRKGLKARTITIKVRVTGFHTFTRGVTLNKATNFSDQIYKQAERLYGKFESHGKKIRLVGVKASHFCDAGVRDTIFIDKVDEKKERIYSAIDSLKDKYGDDVIVRGAGVKVR